MNGTLAGRFDSTDVCGKPFWRIALDCGCPMNANKAMHSIWNSPKIHDLLFQTCSKVHTMAPAIIAREYGAMFLSVSNSSGFRNCGIGCIIGPILGGLI